MERDGKRATLWMAGRLRLAVGPEEQSACKARGEREAAT